jgi:hypothetical protein
MINIFIMCSLSKGETVFKQLENTEGKSKKAIQRKWQMYDTSKRLSMPPLDNYSP